VKRLSPTLMAAPFLNWLVEIMPSNTPETCLFLLRKTPRYYRTDFRGPEASSASRAQVLSVFIALLVPGRSWRTPSHPSF
jgi:hypothetical protein